LRSFLLAKTKLGKEEEILKEFETLDEAREVHLVTGKFDLFVVLESAETYQVNPRRRVGEVVIRKIRRTGGMLETRTIIPVDSYVRPVKHESLKPKSPG